MNLAHFKDIHLVFFFHLVVNKLMTDKTKTSFYSIVEYSNFVTVIKIEIIEWQIGKIL